MKDAIKREQNDACINSAEVTEQREQCERAQTLPSRDGTRCNQREHARPTVTVKDIFALRKQGKIEEAYEAIRPIYREHKGKYTTLCMFWTASDVFKLRLQQGRVEEAEKIYEALKRMLPHVQKIEEEDSKAEPEVVGKQEQSRQKNNASGFMHYAEGRLIKESERFRKRYFAMRDRKKRAQAQAAAPPDEGLNIPLNNPSEPSDVIPSIVIPSNPPVIPTGVEESEISPCASLSRDDKKEGGRDDNHAVIPSVVEGPLSNGQQAVLDCIKAHPGLKVPGIEAETGIPSKSIERHIKVLIERNLIEHRGSKKTGGYHAL